MSETHATTPVFPPGRYGRRREGGPRRLVPIVWTLVFALGLGGLTWGYYVRYGSTDYTADIIGWSDSSDREMVIEFRVRVPEGATAMCMLRARDFEGYEVGRRAVTVPAPDGGGTVEVREAVPTKERGAVGDVMGCRPAS
ncbi:DUF4307 domain-containing protein [Actinoplanes couchii]|uniref:DUF4307 domain-containing protein n=1 Tax=Actinoplanes couchii TaxID=403638 RepID=A0ABQ3XBU0_9ACTN|nr:DUF4307 domain-containing protein [Actinoplanes couchii]MDR6323425.1 hypothetical protein [Actinoplanes couchii]GID55939.1 hypothetical protein Aco03nite_043430 [Actinoplanes couchii]